MDADAAKALKVGDRVIWDDDPEDRGEVIETGYCAVKITWENGQTGIIHVNDCARVSAARDGG
jgi:hypothetical protein